MSYALIGDLHSQIAPLTQALDYCVANNLRPLFLGDVFDSRCERSNSVEVYNTLREAQRSLNAIILRSNHQDKLERLIRGNNVFRSPELLRTIEDFEKANILLTEVGRWLETMPYGFCFKENGREYRCAHAYFPSWQEVPEYFENLSIFDATRKAKQLMMYGPSNKDGKGRVFWWEKPTERSWTRVAGHYHVVHSDERNLVLDAGCGGIERSWFCEEPPALVLFDTVIGQMVEIRAYELEGAN
jgi:hypothetical protein